MSCGLAEPTVRKSPAETCWPLSIRIRAWCWTSYVRSSISCMAIVMWPSPSTWTVPDTGDGMSVLPFVRRSGLASASPTLTWAPSSTLRT